MSIPTITLEEKNRLTDQAARLFVARHVNDYFPCELNSQKLCNFITSQLGENYPFVWTLDHLESAFAYLNEHDFLLQRPVEVEDKSAQITEQQRALEAANTNLAACKAEEIRIAKRMPLKELGQFTSVENAKLRAQRSVAARTQTDSESNRLTKQELDARAQARLKVMTENPGLSRTSVEFSKLVAAELAAQ
jgi:hypothetical protein